VLSAELASTSGVSYCLVKVLVAPAINIWVGLPSAYNDRFMALRGFPLKADTAPPFDSSTAYTLGRGRAAHALGALRGGRRSRHSLEARAEHGSSTYPKLMATSSLAIDGSAWRAATAA